MTIKFLNVDNVCTVKYPKMGGKIKVAGDIAEKRRCFCDQFKIVYVSTCNLNEVVADGI